MPTFKSLAERRSFWKRHVIACIDSGLSKASYCREHQLTYHQLIYWIAQFDTKPTVACVDTKPPGMQNNKASRLLPVVLRDDQPAQSGLQITLPSGVMMITGITEQQISVALQLVVSLRLARVDNSHQCAMGGSAYLSVG